MIAGRVGDGIGRLDFRHSYFFLPRQGMTAGGRGAHSLNRDKGSGWMGWKRIEEGCGGWGLTWVYACFPDLPAGFSFGCRMNILVPAADVGKRWNTHSQRAGQCLANLRARRAPPALRGVGVQGLVRASCPSQSRARCANRS